MLVLGIAFVIRVHHHVLIAKLGLRPGGANLERSVLKGVKCGFFLAANHFVVRHRRFQIRVPVDNAVTPVNQAVVVHPGEGFIDTAVQGVIQGVPFPTPIGAGAHRPHLGADGSPAVFNKLLETLDERFPTHLVLVGALISQLLLHNGVCCQSSVVGAG